MKTTIGIVDDHQLFVKSLILMLNSFKLYTVIIDAFNGKDLQEKLKGNKHLVPQILLLDVNMPVMDGIATTQWLTDNFPTIKLDSLAKLATNAPFYPRCRNSTFIFRPSSFLQAVQGKVNTLNANVIEQLKPVPDSFSNPIHAPVKFRYKRQFNLLR